MMRPIGIYISTARIVYHIHGFSIRNPSTSICIYRFYQTECWIHIVSILSDYKVLRRCSISNCHSCLWLHYSCVEFLSFIVFHTLMSYVVHGVPFFRFSRCTLSIRLSSLFPSNLCRNRFIVRPLYVNYYRTVTDLLSSIC
jgi:hypothetical protein